MISSSPHSQALFSFSLPSSPLHTLLTTLFIPALFESLSPFQMASVEVTQTQILFVVASLVLYIPLLLHMCSLVPTCRPWIPKTFMTDYLLFLHIFVLFVVTHIIDQRISLIFFWRATMRSTKLYKYIYCNRDGNTEYRALK